MIMNRGDDARGHEEAGMKEHFVRQGDGAGGWSVRPASYRILSLGKEKIVFPYGIHRMDNEQLILLAGLHQGADRYSCVAAFSEDLGETWSDVRDTGVYGRPVATAFFGGGTIVFANETMSRRDLSPQWTMSDDCGRTWRTVALVSPSPDGHSVFSEGDVLVEKTGAAGKHRMMQTAAYHTNFPVGRHTAYVRSSIDYGRTWIDESSPREWIWETHHKGRRFERSVCEGTLARARNGWLVAALRTDMPPRYFDSPNNDSLMGLATSVSKDDGKSWSPLTILYDAGRHHPNLLVMPGGRMVMTYIVRADVRNGKLVSYRRGCEAVVSHDNGLTWDVGRTCPLDEYEFFDGEMWYNAEAGHLSSTLLADGSILTVYGNHLSRGCALIRWRAP